MIEKNLEDVKRLIRVSTGEIPPDLFIENGEILDVYSNALFRGNIWTSGAWIAYVGDKTPPLGTDTLRIDGEGYTLVPGYIDAHGHADLFYNPATFADYVVTRGATTIFSDGHDMVSAVGLGGFAEILKHSDAFAVKYLWGVPATYPPFPEIEGGDLFTFEEIKGLFETYRDCVSISELSAYRRILSNDEEILKRILLSRSLGRNVEGHTLGASYDKLNALVAAGITSCHESIRESDLRNRLRLGLYTMIRHSSIRSDFQELCPVVKSLPLDSIILVSDGIFAHELCAKGYMDFVIEEAIAYGLDPKDAIKMSTLNPARYFKRDGDVGSITPGRIADILFLEKIDKPTPAKVIERGRLTAEAGTLLRSPAAFPHVGTTHNPFRFTSIDRDELMIPGSGGETVPVIDIVDRTVTRRLDAKLGRDGRGLRPSREEDIRKVLYTRRHRKAWGKGFVHGFGAKIGGIASSIAHETHGLILLGFDDDDIVLAAQEVLRMGGGVILVEKGEILCRFPLPNGGIMSDLGIGELSGELQRINSIMQDRGSLLNDPLWTMGFLTFTSIVELRITPSGVYDVRRGAIVF